MNTKELTNQVYDTLLDNVGLSSYHVKFDSETVTNQEIIDKAGIIYLEIDKVVYKIKVEVAQEMQDRFTTE